MGYNRRAARGFGSRLAGGLVQIVPLVRPGGYFICKQVAGRNLQSIYSALGWGSCGGQWQGYWREHNLPAQDNDTLAADFSSWGFSVVARGEYDVPFYFQDVAPLVFYLKALLFPEPFDVETHGQAVARLIEERSTPKGIASNEHRSVLIVRRQ